MSRLERADRMAMRIALLMLLAVGLAGLIAVLQMMGPAIGVWIGGVL